MDNADPDNLNGLVALADALINTNAASLDAVAKRLAALA